MHLPVLSALALATLVCKSETLQKHQWEARLGKWSPGILQAEQRGQRTSLGVMNRVGALQKLEDIAIKKTSLCFLLMCFLISNAEGSITLGISFTHKKQTLKLTELSVSCSRNHSSTALVFSILVWSILCYSCTSACVSTVQVLVRWSCRESCSGENVTCLSCNSFPWKGKSCGQHTYDVLQNVAKE